MTTHQLPPVTTPEFRERPQCIACGSTALHSKWSGRYTDEPTRTLLKSFHYHGFDVDSLAGKRFDLVRCADCGQAFHRSVLTDQWLGVLYSDWIDSTQIEDFEREHAARTTPAERFEFGRQATKHVLRLGQLLQPLAGDGPMRVLDFGCGDGDFLLVARSFGFEVSGIDSSASRDSRAACRGLGIYPSLEAFDRAVGEPLHAVTMFEVLEHLPDPLGVLEALADRMVSGGVLIVEVPNCEGIKEPEDFHQFHAVQPLEHINTFTPDSLRAICARAGFEPQPRMPAHVTTRLSKVGRGEAGRFLHRRSTDQYFRLRS